MHGDVLQLSPLRTRRRVPPVLAGGTPFFKLAVTAHAVTFVVLLHARAELCELGAVFVLAAESGLCTRGPCEGAREG